MTTPTGPGNRDLLRESLAAIERLKARVAALEGARREPIAIVGIGCRYPGAPSPEALWDLLVSGRDAVTDVPADRWDGDAMYDPTPGVPGKSITKRGGFLEPLEGFDAQFFGISPREAVTLDPQQRLLLEVAWETLEDAGIAPDGLTGSATGVFIGVTTNDYGHRVGLGTATDADVYAATGNALNAAAGRIAFVLGAQGPCLAIDTACSSGLVAVHEACQALRAGECDLALAGGVNVILSSATFALFSKWGMLAPDGRCKAFDEGADGMVRAEGCGMIALKRLGDATAAGDRILALVRGSAVNHDGRSSGLTVPNGLAQEAVLSRALASAGLTPAEVDYVEAHGTGTPLGDPIEAEALGAVYGRGRPADRPLLVGSIKTNIGHTESASGLAGLLKVVLSLRGGLLPAHLHFTKGSSRIPWADLPLSVVAEPRSWPGGDRPRHAGVSSFGFSGTNAHVVLAEAPTPKPLAPASAPERSAHLLVVTAKTPSALRVAASDYRELLEGGAPLPDVAHGAGIGRAGLPERLAISAGQSDEAAAELARWLAGEPSQVRSARAEPGWPPRTAWLFTGQGSQYVGMGHELYRSEPVFRDVIDRCAGVLERHRSEGLQDILFADQSGRLDRTGWTQPALFSLELALAELLRSWGLTPAAVAGHSLGEYVAATVAGVFSPEDALSLVAERAALMESLPPGGAMAAVELSEAAALELPAVRAGNLSIAAVNGPGSVVLSGPEQLVNDVVGAVAAGGKRAARLTVSHAFHSRLMEPVIGPLAEAVGRVTLSRPRIPIAANVSGTLAGGAELASPDYWVRQLRSTVRFGDAVRALAEGGCDTFLEVGPHPVLLGMARETLGEDRAVWLPLLRRGRNDWRSLLDAMAEHVVRGGAFDWSAFDRGRARSRVALPRTRFERHRHWIEPKPAAVNVPGAMPTGHPLLGNRHAGSGPSIRFLAAIGLDSPPFLADHVVAGSVIFPGTGYLELALAAGRAQGWSGPIEVRDLEVLEPLILEDTTVLLQVTTESSVEGLVRIEIASSASSELGAPWRVHAIAALRQGAGAAANTARPAAELRSTAMGELDVAAYYEGCARQKLDYGPAFRGLESLRTGGTSEAMGSIAIVPDGAPWQIHPALLDACFHVLGASILAERGADAPPRIYLPMGIESVVSLMPAGHRVVCTARVRPGGAGSAVRIADLRLESESGELVGSVTGLRLRELDPEDAARLLRPDRPAEPIQFTLDWDPIEIVPASNVGRLALVGAAGGLAGSLAIALTGRGVAVDVLEAPPTDPGGDWLGSRIESDPPRWVIHCAEGGTGPGDPTGAAEQLALLGIGRALSRSFPGVGLGLLTRGAQGARSSAVSPSESALLGLARTISAERGESAGFRLDLDRACAGPRIEVVLAAIAVSGAEPELIERGGRLFAPRLVPAGPEPDQGARAVVRIPERGTLDRLTLDREPRRPPKSGEVEIEIRAAGLNFRDVLNTLGMYPGDPGPLGSECAGLVTAVGAGVTGLEPGDRVVGFAIDSLATHVTAPAKLVVSLPETLSFAEAVTLPNAYVTAAMALQVAGRIQPGQWVLVHAAAGGVGLMAVRLARSLGARVIGTGGSAEKRRRIMDEGAAHAFDSRSTGFAADVLAATDGRGVDLVINSLTGDFIAAGFRTVVPGGCFVELGKGGIWTEAEAAERAPGIRYEIIDVGRTIDEDLATVRRLLEEAVAATVSGRCPPLPHHDFDLAAAPDAFRFMAMARHIGKIVLEPAPVVSVRSDASYLVTGGIRGIGFEAAEKLALQGAKSLVLVGRSPPDAETGQRIAALRDRGVLVKIVLADVSDAEAVARLWREELTDLPPVAGIIHAAGVVEDAPLEGQTAGHFARVAAPKSDGAWNLHLALGDAPLDFFLLFSSASATFGAPGQANYAAANGFLDGFAAWRRSRGLPATSIAWGVWSEVGMAARVPEAVRRRWAEAGIKPLAPGDALEVIGSAIRSPSPVVIAMGMDRTRLAQAAGSGVRALLRRHRPAATTSPASSPPGFRSDLEAARPEDRQRRAADRVRAEVVAVLGLGPQSPPSDQDGLSALGMDSLMAMELRTRLQRLTGRSLPATVAFEHPTVAALTAFLLSELGLPVKPADDPEDPSPVDDAEVARLLNDELDLAGF